jgi:hypothetical protein
MSIVRDLQKLALDSKSDITQLLRQTYFAARKLKIKDLENWAKSEMDGYQENVPTYRHIRGEVMALNPYHGWFPVGFQNAHDVAEKLSIWHCPLSVGEIQVIIHDSTEGFAWCSFPSQTEQYLRETLISPGTRFKPQFQTKLKIPSTQFHSILNTVRNYILDWSMKLEEDGILGEEMTFNEKEIQMAATHNYMNSIIYQGNVQNAQAQGTANSSNQTMTIGTAEFDATLKQIVDNIQKAAGATAEQAELAEAHAGALQSQAQLPAIKRSSGIIEKALKGLSATSNALSISKNVHDLLPEIMKFLS